MKNQSMKFDKIEIEGIFFIGIVTFIASNLFEKFG